MDQHLYKYLVLHKSLSIPQLGSFNTKNEPAHVEKETGLLHAPKQAIYFSEGDVPGPEKLFFDFLATETGVDEVTAIKQFHDFSYQLRNDLLEKKQAEIEGIGWLKKGTDDAIVFYPANDPAQLSPPLQYGDAVLPTTGSGSESSYTVEEYEVEERPDRWWITAILLLVLGIGALLLYYNY